VSADNIILIEVTQSNIARGTQGDPCACPIALAFRDTGRLATVNTVDVIIDARIAMLPDEAVRFIEDFDAGYPVAPFSFEIELPFTESEFLL
jgi:hypothetical protein